MSKRPTEPSDWSSGAESLFSAARDDHSPTAADRLRVRAALARRLHNTSTAPAAHVGSSASQGASRVAVSTIAKIGLGVALVLTGAYASMQAFDSKRRIEPQPAPAQVGPTVANAPEHAAKPEVVREPAAERSTEEAAPSPIARADMHTDIRAAARGTTDARRARTTAARVAPGRTPTPSQPTLQAAAEPTPSDPAPVASVANVAREDAVPSSNADSRPLPAAQASPLEARVQVKAEAPAAAETPTDVPAELAFVMRLNAAMAASKLRTVLALCIEHERRWPHGTFVQERQGLRAIAACRLGLNDGDALARSFVASYPRGPLVARVREACEVLSTH